MHAHANRLRRRYVLGAWDHTGGSCIIHAFGASFAVGCTIFASPKGASQNPDNAPRCRGGAARGGASGGGDQAELERKTEREAGAAAAHAKSRRAATAYPRRGPPLGELFIHSLSTNERRASVRGCVVRRWRRSRRCVCV